ncbi:MAG: c-type cytochrome [Rhodospirillales bacterium]
MKIRGVAVVAFCVLFVGMYSFGAGAQSKCLIVPSVSWWGNQNHDSIRNFVKSNHGGDWRSYSAKWKRQHAKLKSILGKGNSIVAPNGAKLGGDALSAYIVKVGQRIAVIDCLAAQNTGSGKQTASVQRTGKAVKGDPQAGKAAALKRGCLECHGDEGRSKRPLVPNLAGQKYQYLVKQFRAFAALAKGTAPPGSKDVRHHPLMSKKAKTLSPADMEHIAAYFAGL